MKDRFRRPFLYVLLVVLTKIINIFPLKFSLALGKFLGYLTYIFLFHYSDITKQNLKKVFKNEKTPKQINKIAADVFKNIGMNAAEVLNMHRIKKIIDKKIYAVGAEKVDQALSKGKGVIMLGAHFGNWELAPMYFAAKGYPSNVIARHIYYEKYDEFVGFLRSATGANVIFRDEFPKKIIEVLKNNELLGITIDQDIDSVESVFVDFFNMPAYTPVAPIALALKTECEILPCFMVREGNRHRITVEDPLNITRSGDKEKDIKDNLQKFSLILETYIRKYPGQWVWMHERWKTKPHASKINNKVYT